MTRAFPELTKQEEEQLKAEGRKRCREDLHYLAKHVLGYNKITDHYHKKMAMDIDTPKYKFKLLLHPRGHFKSTLGTESRTIHLLLNDPNERILLTNAKLDNSRKFLRAIARHFNQNHKFRWMWRDWWISQYVDEETLQYADDKNIDWIVRHVQDELILLRPDNLREASITTGAVDASMVSQHYSTIIADDLINREFITTPEQVEKSILYFKDLLDLLDPDGNLEIIGTRWAHHDLYSWIINEFGHKASIRVPDGYLDDNIIEKSKQTPDEEKDWMISIQPCFDEYNQPIFPEEFTSKVLNNLRASKGPYEFGAQYLLNPTPKEDQRFKEEWFRKIDTLPDPKTLTVCMTVDPAISLQDEACRSAAAVCGYDEQNRMYLLDGFNERLGTEDFPEAVFELAKKWQEKSKVFLPVGFEAIGFQEVYVYNIERMMLERGIYFAIEEIKRRAQSKDERILKLVPRIKHGFYVPRRLIKQPYSSQEGEYDLVHRLEWQLTRFPYAGEKDLADTLADQLTIVKPTSLPNDTGKPGQPEKKREFVHRSIKEDKGKMPRKVVDFNDAVR